MLRRIDEMLRRRKESGRIIVWSEQDVRFVTGDLDELLKNRIEVRHVAVSEWVDAMLTGWTPFLRPQCGDTVMVSEIRKAVPQFNRSRLHMVWWCENAVCSCHGR